MKIITATLLVIVSIVCIGIAQQSKNSTTPRERDRIRARAALRVRVTGAWEKSGTKEPLNLIVLDADERGRVYEDQIRRVFPEGRAHLPETLTPRVIYCSTPACARAVQHLGRAEQNGFHFVIMRWIEPVNQ